MGVSRDLETRRQATFHILDGGLAAFGKLRARIRREATLTLKSPATLMRELGFDPKTWREIEFVLTAAGVDLHGLTIAGHAELDAGKV